MFIEKKMTVLVAVQMFKYRWQVAVRCFHLSALYCTISIRAAQEPLGHQLLAYEFVVSYVVLRYSDRSGHRTIVACVFTRVCVLVSVFVYASYVFSVFTVHGCLTCSSPVCLCSCSCRSCASDGLAAGWLWPV